MSETSVLSRVLIMGGTVVAVTGAVMLTVGLVRSPDESWTYRCAADACRQISHSGGPGRLAWTGFWLWGTGLASMLAACFVM